MVGLALSIASFLFLAFIGLFALVLALHILGGLWDWFTGSSSSRENDAHMQCGEEARRRLKLDMGLY